MAETSPERAAMLDAKKRCIVCESDHPLRRFGLCPRHYERYRKVRATVPADRRDAFDSKLIAQGALLPKRQGQRQMSSEDVFSDAAAEFVDLSGLPPADQSAVARSLQELQALPPQPAPEEPATPKRPKKRARQ